MKKRLADNVYLVVVYMLVKLECLIIFFFFFQAEDGIRDKLVTGVQTCALPIWRHRLDLDSAPRQTNGRPADERLARIGRASCRERGVDLGGRRIIKKKKKKKHNTRVRIVCKVELHLKIV